MRARRILGWVAIGVLGLLVVAVMMIGGIILYDTVFPSQHVADFTNVTYADSDGVTLRAYLARPTGAGPHPALVMVHEFFGLNEDVVKKADALAREGYVVLAVDAYRNQTTAMVPRAIWLVVTTPQDRIAQDIDAGFAYLTRLEGVDSQRVGAVGFCFGGTQVMKMSARNPDLAASVIYYGSGPFTRPDQLGVMGARGPVLGIYGEQDNSIPVSEVRAFEQAMQARGVRHQVTIYPGVGHAFVKSDNIVVPGAAQQAWSEMLAFLDKSLKARG
jgi:carboxymethylenebutenolidase